MIERIKNKLSGLYKKTFSETAEKITQLPLSGSPRLYFRISSATHIAIGTYNDNRKENNSFIYLSKHFAQKNISVPKVFAHDLSEGIYLQEDMGEDTLYNFIQKNTHEKNFEKTRKKIYKNVLNELINIQTQTTAGLDFSKCFPREAFDKQSIQWDLNYFKYLFLKPANIDFDEQLLENDFSNFTDFLLEAPSDFFMFRDFQSRNIMYNNNVIAFIDYQGGRKGALQYDPASLLYDAKAELPEQLREELIEFYANLVEQKTGISKPLFFKYYLPFVLLRIMQAMGAYGYRGLIENKIHFIQSIAPAQKNISTLLQKSDFLNHYPELQKVLQTIAGSKKLSALSKAAVLNVTISSFSYKRGIPYDAAGHGGGFVFDCRFLNNPGRLEKYKQLTGKDIQVINYLKKHSEADQFAENCFKLIQPAIENYMQRNFTQLNIAFGCTGGQHRSVYLAEKLSEILKMKYLIPIDVQHLEQKHL